MCTPRFQGLRPEYLTKDLVAISPDTVVIVDSVDAKNIQILDANSGKPISKIAHTAEVSVVHLNQHTLGPQERLLAFVDRNKDLWIAHLGAPATGGNSNAPQILPTFKLHSQVSNVLLIILSSYLLLPIYTLYELLPAAYYLLAHPFIYSIIYSIKPPCYTLSTHLVNTPY